MTPDGVGGGGLVSVQVAGEEAVEVAGDDGQGGVEVDVERDAAGERVEVEPGDVGVELVFDLHAFGVAGEQVFAGGIVKLLTLCGGCEDWSLWRLRRGTRATGIRSRSSGTRCGCITVSREPARR